MRLSATDALLAVVMGLAVYVVVVTALILVL